MLIDAEAVVRETAIRGQHAVHRDAAHLAGFTDDGPGLCGQDAHHMVHSRRQPERLRIERHRARHPGQRQEGNRSGIDTVLISARPVRIAEWVVVVKGARTQSAHLEGCTIGIRYR